MQWETMLYTASTWMLLHGKRAHELPLSKTVEVRNGGSVLCSPR